METITEDLVKDSRSFTELIKKLGKFPNSRLIKETRIRLTNDGINFDHFTTNGSKTVVMIRKECPVCGNPFEVNSTGKQSKKVTCSYSCSNTYFAEKRNKPENYKNHRTICFKYHKKECVICKEKNVVEAHHYDGNTKNNHPTNFVPLCPTHHQYWHSKFRYLIKEKIDRYVIEFKRLSGSVATAPVS